MDVLVEAKRRLAVVVPLSQFSTPCATTRAPVCRSRSAAALCERPAAGV